MRDWGLGRKAGDGDWGLGQGARDWGLGQGARDWGLGTGDWGLARKAGGIGIGAARAHEKAPSTAKGAKDAACHGTAVAEPGRAQSTQRTALTIAECRSRAFRISERGLAGPSSAPTGPGVVAAGGAARPRSGPTRNPWAGSGFRNLFFPPSSGDRIRNSLCGVDRIRLHGTGGRPRGLVLYPVPGTRRRGEACLPAGREIPPPLPGRVRRIRLSPTGCASPAMRRAALHPRLHAAAPAGAWKPHQLAASAVSPCGPIQTR